MKSALARQQTNKTTTMQPNQPLLTTQLLTLINTVKRNPTNQVTLMKPLRYLLDTIDRAPTKADKLQAVGQLYYLLNTHWYSTQIVDKFPKLEETSYNKALEFVSTDDEYVRHELKQFIDRYEAKRSSTPVTRARARKYNIPLV